MVIAIAVLIMTIVVSFCGYHGVWRRVFGEPINTVMLYATIFVSSICFGYIIT